MSGFIFAGRTYRKGKKSILPPQNGIISQKTEDLVGPYELHDFFLYYMLRCTCTPDKIFRMAQIAFKGTYDKDEILKWLKIFYFGNQLEDALMEVGINTEGLVKDKSVNTTLAFVHTLEDGDREFAFYRKPGADMMITSKEVNENIIKSSKVFHFGSLSMTDELCRQATKDALKIAKDEGLIITYDPNLRESLWSNLTQAKELIEYGMSLCDVMKISDNEVLWFTGKDNYEDAIKEIQNKNKTNVGL